MSRTHHLTRVWLDDPDLAEECGMNVDDPDSDCWLFTANDKEMLTPEFRAWCRKRGIRPSRIRWTEGSGMNISGAEYAEVTARKKQPS